MSDSDDRSSIRARGEEAIGDLAQALLDNPLFGGAVSRTLGAGERAAQVQRSALGALNLASAADLERIERRLRSLSDRLEEVEDSIDELASVVGTLRRRVDDAAASSDAAPDQESLAGSESGSE